MDFKKLKKSSSKKFIKGGLGFFLSPREDKEDGTSKDNTKNSTTIPAGRKPNNWDNEGLKINYEVEIQGKDYIGDIPIIPSLDDFADDDVSNEIAKAPLVGVKRVALFKELENDILRHSAFATLEEVNMQALVKLLHPESFLDEPDTPWTKDSLFNELVCVINERKF